MAKDELMTLDKFQIVTGTEQMDEETKAELADEMGDLDDDSGIDAKHIKIPSGGGKAYEVETDDPDDPEVMKEVQGVVIFTHRMNAYWARSFGATDEDGNTNKLPDCSSMDGETGTERETGASKRCATCPYNQFGSAGRGKACKNMRRLYIMMSGRPDIYLLTVPPTSIKDVNKMLKKIMGSMHMPYSRMVLSFKLAAAESGDGIKYSRVTVESAGLLPKDAWPLTHKMREELKKEYDSIPIAPADVEAAPTSVEPASAKKPAGRPDSNGFMKIPDSLEGEELPFE